MTISPRFKRRLVVMVKEPHPGRVKTRLGRDIGMTGAAWWFRHQCARLLRDVQGPRWETILSVSPDHEGMQSRVWPSGLQRWPQGRGDIGQRMARIFDVSPPGPLVIIGADIPGVRTTHIQRAFAALGDHDMVFGPATDGGFWLVGMQHPAARPPGLFTEVRWSGPHALVDAVLSAGNRRIAMTDRLADVDTAADLVSFSTRR